jgi:hypothetical protein
VVSAVGINTLVGKYAQYLHHVRALERHKQRIGDLGAVLFAVPVKKGGRIWPMAMSYSGNLFQFSPNYRVPVLNEID